MAKRKRGHDNAVDSVTERPATSGASNGIRNGDSSHPNKIPKTVPESSQPLLQLPNSVVQIPPSSVLTPWKSTDIPNELPPLPSVNDPALLNAAFTHSGLVTAQNEISYERLEWVGDAYIYLYSTVLISQTFPSFSPGKSSETRELLLKNKTLANYARQYNFEARAQLPKEFKRDASGRTRATDDEKMKVMADMFEAYVAAIILADVEHGAERAASWLKQLWGRTIRDRIKAQEEKELQQQQQQHQHQHQQVETKPEPVPNFNAKVKLAQMLKTKGVELNYRDSVSDKKDPENGKHIFIVGVFLSGWGYENVKLGEGEAYGKKEAGAKAAEMALANKELVQPFHELKMAFDEKNRREREAEELEG